MSVAPARRRQIRGLIICVDQALARRARLPGANYYHRDLTGGLTFPRSYGVCRWCRRPCPPPARFWHPECVTAYRVARGIQDVRIADIPHLLAERTCQQCGASRTARRPLELDHRLALSVAWSRGDRRSLLLAYDVSNLRWLCGACHALKTGEDRRRANNLRAGRAECHSPPAPAAPPDGQLALI